ncbi:MAG TPA: glycosyltransferase [Chthoniobacterales bacterium]|nr:glycosyltransferase [Chthoniobacterales bacterium]
MKICDLTQFYSPLSGGVKRYVHEKIEHIQKRSPDDEHVLIVPGEKTDVVAGERSRIYSIRSPLVSRTSRYRALINLRAVGEILRRERPDIIESADPYQVGWKAASAGKALRIPVVAFYHSHFPEAYLRGAAKLLGKRGAKSLMAASRSYVRKLYNRFQATLVPSPQLASVLKEWGVRNVREVNLGVNTERFSPTSDDPTDTRRALGIAPQSKLLLYVGRLAPEKNTAVLFKAFKNLAAKSKAGEFHLLVVGDGPQREQLRRLETQTGNVKWIQYCTDSLELARFYRAADVFVHPGTQETFGLVALESQACATPVVGIRGSQMDRIIFHDQDLWARENTPEALAEAIEQFAKGDLKAMGAAAAQAAAERYAWPRVFERLFCIYREVCAAYKGLSR